MIPAFEKSITVTTFRKVFTQIEKFRLQLERSDSILQKMPKLINSPQYNFHLTKLLITYLEEFTKLHDSLTHRYKTETIRLLAGSPNSQKIFNQEFEKIQNEIVSSYKELDEGNEVHQLAPGCQKIALKSVEKFVDKVFQPKTFGGLGGPLTPGEDLIRPQQVELGRIGVGQSGSGGAEVVPRGTTGRRVLKVKRVIEKVVKEEESGGGLAGLKDRVAVQNLNDFTLECLNNSDSVRFGSIFQQKIQKFRKKFKLTKFVKFGFSGRK